MIRLSINVAFALAVATKQCRLCRFMSQMPG